MQAFDFLVSRIDYLKALPNIGVGWISDGQDSIGLAPTQTVCGQTIKLLEDLQMSGLELKQSTLLMGPIPSGGLELELRLSAGTAFLSLFNSGVAQLAFDWIEPSWGEQELPATEAIQHFANEIRKNLKETNDHRKSSQ